MTRVGSQRHSKKMLLNCSTCFERHTAHHQELKTVMTEWELSSHSAMTPAGNHKRVKTRGCNYSFELLIMIGVSLETC